MNVAPPTRSRLGRAVDEARHRRGQRLDRANLRSEIASYQTTSELAELSAIASRHPSADSAEIRTLLVEQLSH
jgi:hypothetical protein